MVKCTGILRTSSELSCDVWKFLTSVIYHEIQKVSRNYWHNFQRKKKTFYIFRYTVSAETGYVAEVSYEGTPVYPKVKKA